jgi:DAK2 domain fusion protein YloV
VHEVDITDGAAAGGPLPHLDAAAVRRWYDAALTVLTVHRRTVDELNVFPVPDGDTGTNLAATMRSACQAMNEPAVAQSSDTLPQLARRAARGALLGARGNSGVILAQILQGFADSWQGPRVGAAELAAGLRAAADAATDAVAAPAEGTILTVASAAAQAASHRLSAGLADTCVHISQTAAAALSATVDQLPALTRAGVVDAGGLGLALILDALVEVVTGEPTGTALAAADSGARAARSRVATEVPRESGSLDYAYEVQFLVDADVESVTMLRAALSDLGDSLVVVGAAGPDVSGPLRTWNVHIHVNDVGAAVEAGINCGRLYRLSVTRFADQPSVAPVSPNAGDRGIVVLAEGRGLASLLRGEGVRTVDSARPSTEEVLLALRGTGCGDVIVLSDESDHAVAESAATLARADGYRVAVIPTRSPVQALAAIAVRDETRRFDDDVIAMAEAAGACRHAEVTVAARAGLTSVGRCETGDFLGLADGDVILLGTELAQVLRDLADRLCAAGAELITIVTGSGLPQAARKALIDHLAGQWPLVEVQCLDGGQSRHLVWIGAE